MKWHYEFSNPVPGKRVGLLEKTIWCPITRLYLSWEEKTEQEALQENILTEQTVELYLQPDPVELTRNN